MSTIPVIADTAASTACAEAVYAKGPKGDEGPRGLQGEPGPAGAAEKTLAQERIDVADEEVMGWVDLRRPAEPPVEEPTEAPIPES